MTNSSCRPPDLTHLGESHVGASRESDGEVGYLRNGVPTLLLASKGRKTGQPHTTPSVPGRDGDDHLVVASMGGAPR